MSKEEDKKPAWYVTNILVPVVVEIAKDIGKRIVDWVWGKLFPKDKDESD